MKDNFKISQGLVFKILSLISLKMAESREKRQIITARLTVVCSSPVRALTGRVLMLIEQMTNKKAGCKSGIK